MYRIKVFFQGDLGWLYIVDDNQEARLYTLEEAKEAAKGYGFFNKNLYSIVDENDEEVVE